MTFFIWYLSVCTVLMFFFLWAFWFDGEDIKIKDLFIVPALAFAPIVNLFFLYAVLNILWDRFDLPEIIAPFEKVLSKLVIKGRDLG